MIKARILALYLLSSIVIYGCSKTQNVNPVTPPHGEKTAPDNYAKTVTDGSTSLIATWKPISGYTTFYDKDGVLIGVSPLGAAALSQLQFLDATNFKEIHSGGDVYATTYTTTTTDNTTYIKFVSDEGFTTYGVDTLMSNRLAISQIAKYPGGVVFNINGSNYTAYEYVLHFNYNK